MIFAKVVITYENEQNVSKNLSGLVYYYTINMSMKAVSIDGFFYHNEYQTRRSVKRNLWHSNLPMNG